MEDSGRRTPVDMLRWMGGRLLHRPPPDPPPHALPLSRPDLALPHVQAGEVRLTWVGQSTFLVQVPGLNLLTDPHWSERASPSQWFGPRRLVIPGVAWESLPPIDVVLLSHDHFDHLDEDTVRRLHARFGDPLRWITPLGYRAWFASRGIRNLTELDWWQEAELTGARVTCAPAQHWTRRGLREYNDRLWGSFSIRLPDGRGVYFAGDSGYFTGYAELGARLGPWDALLMPIGAYDPRWFMKPAHMNPEEAVQAYLDLGGRGAFLAMHWGTFRLTDEYPLEPTVRTRTAWEIAGLPAGDLHIPAHGETVTLPPR
jgi:N-acyl-phosphatidylethanolamine-hydrolysing phospholipase D